MTIMWNEGSLPKLGQSAGSGGGGGPSTDPNATHFKGNWSAGTYARFDQVMEDGWLAIANTSTTDHAAPQEDGSPSYELGASPSWTEEESTAQKIAGHQYTFTQSGWLRKIEAWMPYASKQFLYRAVAIDVTDPAKKITRPLFSFKGGIPTWQEIDNQDLFIESGTVLQVFLVTENIKEQDSWQYQWQYGNNGGGTPGFGFWNTNAGNTQIIISNFNYGVGVDRTSSFALLTAGDQITITNNSQAGERVYTITSVVNNFNNTHTFNVTLDSQSGAFATNNICDVHALLGDPPAAQYVEIVDHFAGTANDPTWAQISGVDYTTGVIVLNDNAYGVRMEFQPAIVSADWDLQSYKPRIS